MTPLSIAPGVRVHGLLPEMLLAIQVAHARFARHDVPLVITSAIDGRHMVTSGHYAGRAVDLRVKHLNPAVWSTLTADITQDLGPDYTVLLELNPPHLHIEWKPRTPYA